MTDDAWNTAAAKPIDLRPSWDEYYLGIVAAVALRAECTRRKVGALIVRPDHSIVEGGYNGSPAGSELSCLRGDCPRGRLDYADLPARSSYDTGAGECIALHAEMNAIARARESVDGYTMYLTCAPCDGCKKLIQAARLARIVWPDGEWKP